MCITHLQMMCMYKLQARTMCRQRGWSLAGNAQSPHVQQRLTSARVLLQHNHIEGLIKHK